MADQQTVQIRVQEFSNVIRFFLYSIFHFPSAFDFILFKIALIKFFEC